MGWNTANEIFDPVCAKLQHSHLWDSTRKDILVTLIQTLQDGDWDTEDESLERFKDDAIVVRAFGQCGVHLYEKDEYDIDLGF